MKEIADSGTWSSALSTHEFAAIRSVGFEPAGQVLGAAVYNIGYSGRYGCPSAWGGYYGTSGPFGPAPVRSVTTLSSTGSAYGPLVQTMYQARRSAIGRMVAECSQLGGHGVVGVNLNIRPFPAGGLEFKAIGTAVRAPGAPALKQPFTSDLSGQEFAKLVMSGWVPAGLALGISIGVRHDDWMTTSQRSWISGNNEVTGYTELVHETRNDARHQLERDVSRVGAEGVVIQRMQLRISEQECRAREGARDHIAEVTIIGTAIARFASAAARPAGSLAILSLDPQRRQAARVRVGQNRF
jgi:uncharacterized protein YbjQ (UPF0145 family)